LQRLTPLLYPLTPLYHFDVPKITQALTRAFISCSGDDINEDEVDEDLESALESIKRKVKPGHGNEDPGAAKVHPVMAKRPEVLDDFIRNFLIKMKLEKTLESFQAEW